MLLVDHAVAKVPVLQVRGECLRKRCGPSGVDSMGSQSHTFCLLYIKYVQRPHVLSYNVQYIPESVVRLFYPERPLYACATQAAGTCICSVQSSSDVSTWLRLQGWRSSSVEDKV